MKRTKAYVIWFYKMIPKIKIQKSKVRGKVKLKMLLKKYCNQSPSITPWPYKTKKYIYYFFATTPESKIDGILTLTFKIMSFHDFQKVKEIIKDEFNIIDEPIVIKSLSLLSK
jgi:hypothetical protein